MKKRKRRKKVIVKYERLKILRKKKKILQKQLAVILNCSQRIYSNYERGQVDIPTEILTRLAVFYGTSTDYILGFTDTPQFN